MTTAWRLEDEHGLEPVEKISLVVSVSGSMLHVAFLSPFRHLQSRFCVPVIAAQLALVAPGCHRPSDAQDTASVQTPAALSAAALTDQAGKSRKFSDFYGNTVVLNFFFASCPSVCPRETRALAEVQARLPSVLQAHVQFVSLTVDPEQDSPERLTAFARANGADLNHWSFVRASGSATQALTTELAVFSGPLQARSAPVGHGTSVYLFDARGRLKQRYAGSPLDVARLAREIEELDDWLRKQEPGINQARL